MLLQAAKLSCVTLNRNLKRILLVISIAFCIFLWVCYAYGYDFKRLLESRTQKPRLHLCWESRTNEKLQVEVIGIDQEKYRNRLKAKQEQNGYVFVLPRKMESNRRNDICEGVRHLVRILEYFPEYDGATCQSLGKYRKNNRNNIKSCWFQTRNWTMVISSSSNLQRSFSSKAGNIAVSICNIVESPFLVRQSVLNQIGLKPSYGEATLLDFFLRSNGSLKIAASHGCGFTENQLKMDRGAQKNSDIYLDYGLLGYAHNILRVVREDSIVWTKCSLQTSSCPDRPEESARFENALLPYCCKTRLSRVLADTVDALNQIGIAYRVCFSTLLGAVRSKTIIPWTQDVDICVRKSDYKKTQKLQKVLEIKNYSYTEILGLRRVVPVGPLVKHVADSNLLSERHLFSSDVLKMMKDMLPIRKPEWRSFAYADLYGFDGIFKTKATKVTVDGVEYNTGGEPHSLLFEWFGSNYMSTEKKDRTTSVLPKEPKSTKLLVLIPILILLILLLFVFRFYCLFKKSILLLL